MTTKTTATTSPMKMWKKSRLNAKKTEYEKIHELIHTRRSCNSQTDSKISTTAISPYQCYLISFFKTMQIEMVDYALKCRISYLRFFTISIVAYHTHCHTEYKWGAIMFVVTRENESEKKIVSQRNHLVILYEQSGTQTKKTVNRNTFRCGFYISMICFQRTITPEHHSHLLKTINYSFTHSANLYSGLRSYTVLVGLKIGVIKVVDNVVDDDSSNALAKPILLLLLLRVRDCECERVFFCCCCSSEPLSRFCFDSWQSI